ncbi:hypothetical protein [Halodesulfovibrio aestuarii]|uniref:hypothetical protein n=1 Tax=Halodesulfovibrio aestuarii TaxID=126333 RepID=UPI00047F23AA
MNTLKKVVLVLVMACAFVTFGMHYDASASGHSRDLYVTTRASNVYPDLKTVDRFLDVATHRPKKMKRFMHRNDVYKLERGTRVIKMRSILLDGLDAVVYKVKIPSQRKYGYVFSRNVKKVNNCSRYNVKHREKIRGKHRTKFRGKHNAAYEYEKKCDDRYEEKYRTKFRPRFKATIKTPVLVINLL